MMITAGIVIASVASADPSRRFIARWTWFASAALIAADALRHEHEDRYQQRSQRRRQAERFEPRIERDREFFREQDGRAKKHDHYGRMTRHGSSAFRRRERNCCRWLGHRQYFSEIRTVPRRLDDQKDDVKAQAHGDQERLLAL